MHKNILTVVGITILFLGMSITPLTGSISKASFIYKSNNPPYEPSNPIPPDGATNVHWNSCVRCTGGDPDGDLVTYDIYFGNTTPPHKVISNSSIAIYCSSAMESNTTYYWKVVSTDEHGASTPGPIWSFTTRGNSPPLPPLMWTEDFTTFYILIVDPDEDVIWLYIDWGDGTGEWVGPYESGEIVSLSHVWPDGTSLIKLKARDLDGESQEAVYSLTVSPDFKFLHPSIGYVDLTYKFTIYLEDFGKYLFDWGDGTYSDWVTGIADKSFSYPGEYELRWKAMDIHGYETPWSNPILITILTLGNNPPDTPTIDGPTSCKADVSYDYTFNASDPDGDDIWYHLCWGDKEIIYIYGPYPSGEEITLSYIWTDKGTYTISCWARDVYDEQSDIATLEVTIPRNRVSYLWFLERFPMLEKLLGLIK